jgi:hypothetical protein
LIFGDAASGRGYRVVSHAGLQGGVASVTPEVLHTRNTVSNVLRFWKTIASNPTLRIRRSDTKTILKALFVPATVVDEGSSAAGVFASIWRHAFGRYDNFSQFEAFWLNVYKRSDTAAAIINKAYDRRIQGRASEVTFNTDRAFVRGNDICFLDDQTLASLRYVSNLGETQFQRDRMYLHEGLHWLTKLADPAKSEIHLHRGPVVYLTDRILSELGNFPPAPARIAYKNPPLFSTDEAAHQAWSANLDGLHDWSIAEDRLLDGVLDTGRDYADSMIVMGQKISDRVTVRQGLTLRKKLDGIAQFGELDPVGLYQEVVFAFSMPDIGFRGALAKLITESRTFREIASAWRQVPQLERISVSLSNFDADVGYFEDEAAAHEVSRKSLRINSRRLYYFSDAGVTPLSPMRRFTGALIDYFLSQMMSERSMILESTDSDRGLAVALENEVMIQIGYREPERICAKLKRTSAGILRYQSTMTRAAASENGYLRRRILEGRAGSGLTRHDILGLGQAVPDVPL